MQMWTLMQFFDIFKYNAEVLLLLTETNIEIRRVTAKRDGLPAHALLISITVSLYYLYNIFYKLQNSIIL